MENIHGGHRDRMRSRYLQEGPDGFADHELLEMLLYGCIPRGDTNPVAHLPGMKATTAQKGRDPKVNGNPLRVSEMLASLTGPAYIERVSISTPAQVAAAKKAIRKAFEIQKQGLGFTFIEVVASCPTNWGLTPVKAMEFVREKMIPYYPLGVYKDITVEEGK